MFSMLRDYWNGSYRDIPWKSIAAVAGALLYVMNPLDFIPDLIVGIGFVDDVEFLLDPANKQLHFRSASRVGYSDLGANKRRMNKILSGLRGE